ncbi:MAG TPA: iron-sulfur cluster repair di-iron protein [Flavobacterium sp.]|nr:iron-sulfur cluster repair di-iron protein [Flavobacterium sp.]
MPASQYITIGEFVSHDFRTTSVFSKYGIDFFCGGHRTIEEVCDKKSINHGQLLEELTEIILSTNTNAIDFNSWPLDLLVDYILKKHHRYVGAKIPAILSALDKLCQTHSGEHPELLEIKSLFEGCATDLLAHLKKEEHQLFPVIAKLEKATPADGIPCAAAVPVIADPIASLRQEHNHEAVRFRKIKILTHNYAPPADSCNTYRITYSMLKDFEQDLQEHIHIENNILFPRSIKLEQELVKRCCN